jgi:hypothetical protein
VVKGSFGTRIAPVALQPGPWQQARVTLASLSLKDEDLAKVESVGFVNPSRAMQALVLDEFLLRE